VSIPPIPPIPPTPVVPPLLILSSPFPAFSQLNNPNPWGIAASGEMVWIANNATNNIQATDFTNFPPTISFLDIQIGVGPTGIVFNTFPDVYKIHASDPETVFVLVTQSATVNIFSVGGTECVFAVSNPAHGAFYTGLAITEKFLYVTNFGNGFVDTFPSTFFGPGPDFRFADTSLTNIGYSPFNVFISLAGNSVYVLYAMKMIVNGLPVPVPGFGAINEFTLTGVFIRRLVDNDLGVLNIPSAITVLPGLFPEFPGSFLVGNFGDGLTYLFSQEGGSPVGRLTDCSGFDNIVINGLRGFSQTLTMLPSEVEFCLFSAGRNKIDEGSVGILTACP